MSTRPLTRLFYVSRIVAPLTAVDVQVILGASQVKNRRADITGMLVQTRAHFLQVLEGRPQQVKALMHRIADDARHDGVQQVLELEVSQRLFTDWSMGLAVCPEMSPELDELHRTGTLGYDEAVALMARVLARRADGDAAWS